MKEGNAYTNMLQLIKAHGYNKDINIYVGRLISSSPFKVDLGNGIILDHDDIIITDTANKAVTGDKILVINEENSFYAIDKVVN